MILRLLICNLTIFPKEYINTCHKRYIFESKIYYEIRYNVTLKINFETSKNERDRTSSNRKHDDYQ